MDEDVYGRVIEHVFLARYAEGMEEVQFDRGAQCVILVQAKAGKDCISVVKIEQDFAMCREKFAGQQCRGVGARFVGADLIGLVEFEQTHMDSGVAIVRIW